MGAVAGNVGAGPKLGAEVSHAQNCSAIDVVLECSCWNGTGRYGGSDYPAYTCSGNQRSADACSSGHYFANGCPGCQQTTRWQQAVPRQRGDADWTDGPAAGTDDFTNQDVLEMIRIQKDVKASKTPVVSPRLQAKLSTAAVTVHDEIIRGFGERGYKLGGQIGQEIAKEHPEWLNGSESFSPVHPVGSINQANSIGMAVSITPADSESSPNFVVTPAN
jgi:hypothetical protein